MKNLKTYSFNNNSYNSTLICIFVIILPLMKKLLPLILIIFTFYSLFSQGTVCDASDAFCSDDTFIFPNTFNNSVAEAGPDYGCLVEQRNPAWYFLGVEVAGDINIRISQQNLSGNGSDVDFVCWGPFNDPSTPCTALLTGNCNGDHNCNGNIVDCSYSSSAIENLTISNAQVGTFYIVLITNFEGTEGNITLQQTNVGQPNAGTTDCSIVCSVETKPDQTLCLNTPFTLTTALGNANLANSATYQWFKNNVLLVGETNDELILTPSATPSVDVYKVEVIADNCDDIATDEVTITYVDVFVNFLQTPVPPLYECDADNDGLAPFNLTENQDIIANLENATDYNFLYFEDAAFTNQIPNPNNYTNTTADTQTIYVTMEHKTFLGCNDTTSFIVQTFDTPIANPINNWFECDDNTDGFLAWDFSTLTNIVLDTQNPADFSVTYHNSQADADNNDNPLPLNYTNTVPNELKPIFVRIENNLNTDCFDTTTFTIQVIVIPIITTPNDWLVCDDNNDGFFEFNLATLNNDILNGQNAAEYSISYHKNNTDANANSNPLTTIYTNENAYITETVFIRLENNSNTTCPDISSFNISVFDTPIANNVNNWFECDDDLDGFLVWDLSTLTDTILNGQNPATFTISYHNSQDDATNNDNPISINYTNQLPNTEETLFIRIENNSNTDCFDTNSFTINVIETPIASPIQDWLVCDNDNDGFFEFDFVTETNPQILNGQDDTNIRITYHLQEIFAENNINEIDLIYTNPIAYDEQTIFVRIENILKPECYNITSFIAKVIESPEFNVEDTQYICMNLLPQTITFEARNPLRNYTYSWKDADGNELSTSTTLNAIIDGDYTITATTTDGYFCETTKTVHLLPAIPATITDFTINEYWIEENFSLLLEVTGTGIYQYAIDNIDGPYQEEPYFINIQPGIHTFFVKEMNDCGIISKEIDLFGYAAYFSPNNDGYHDIWKVQGINFKPNAKIYIFDRFGKTITQFNPANNEGWDGNYLGKPAPEGEYWFTADMVDYKGNPIIRKGHFSLIRTKN